MRRAGAGIPSPPQQLGHGVASSAVALIPARHRALLSESLLACQLAAVYDACGAPPPPLSPPPAPPPSPPPSPRVDSSNESNNIDPNTLLVICGALVIVVIVIIGAILYVKKRAKPTPMYPPQIQLQPVAGRPIDMRLNDAALAAQDANPRV